MFTQSVRSTQRPQSSLSKSVNSKGNAKRVGSSGGLRSSMVANRNETLKSSTKPPTSTATNAAGGSTSSTTSMENIEVEYIKNLQQQVYFLELECNYLRQQQMNGDGLQSASFSSKTRQPQQTTLMDSTSPGGKTDRLEQSLLDESQQKKTALEMLEYTEKTFHRERELLLKEISLLKQQKVEIEGAYLTKSAEFSKMQQEKEKEKEKNKTFSSVQSLQEISVLKTRCQELNAENEKLSKGLEKALKQNETDLIMAKRNADLSKTNSEKTRVELDEQNSRVKSLNIQVEQFKLQERLEIKNQAILKRRIAELEKALTQHDSVNEAQTRTLKDQIRAKQNDLDTEKNKLHKQYNGTLLRNKELQYQINELTGALSKQQPITSEDLVATNKALQSKIESLVRQAKIQTNLIEVLRKRIGELQEEGTQTSSSSDNSNQLEEENRKLKAEIELFTVQIKEIDRLKQYEEMFQSQKWSELGQLAENMKSLSQTMTSTASSANNTTN